MNMIENYIRNLDVLNFVVLVILIICITLVLANYFNVCTFSKTNVEKMCSCDQNDGNAVIVGDDKLNYTPQAMTADGSENEKAVLTFYFASWCGHCKAFAPEWDKFANIVANSNLKDTLNMDKIDCEANPGVCSEAGVKGFPTIILQKTDGSKVLYNDYPRTAESVFGFIQANGAV